MTIIYIIDIMTKDTTIEFIQKYGETNIRNISKCGDEPERSMAQTILRIAEIDA
jgi:hypothetical protein